MIVYHLCRSSEVAARLTQGMVRTEGRQYVFHRWEDVERLLNAYGYATKVFASAEAFLDPGAETDADCLLLDIDLGGMSGIEHDPPETTTWNPTIAGRRSKIMPSPSRGTSDSADRQP